MQVSGFDERHLVQEGVDANFVVFIYEGGDARDTSWSVESLLLTDTDLPRTLHWLGENLPPGSCWSLGVVVEPESPTGESDLAVRWIVGADVLNTEPRQRTAEEQRLMEQMVARGDRVDLL